jgi:hypothetical protein
MFSTTCPYSDPPNYGGGTFNLSNPGGRTVYWSVGNGGSSGITLSPMSGVIAPQGKGVLGFDGYSGDYTITIDWSDHVIPTQSLTVMTGCVQVGGP